MLINYLKLRLKLLQKGANGSLDIGFLFVTLVMFLFFFNVENSIWYALVSAFFLCIYHFTRKDFRFVKNILGKQFYEAIVIEYFFIWLFINLFFVFKTHDFTFLLSILLCFVLPFLQIKKQFINPFFISYIPNLLIEWKSQIRKNIIEFICFCVVLGFCGYHLATLVIGLIIWINYLLKIYASRESKELLIVQFLEKSVMQKIIFSSVFCCLFSVPTAVVFLLFNWSEKEYLVYFFTYLFLSNYTIILYKYSVFSEKSKENAINEADFLKFLLMIILVIPAIISIVHHKKIVTHKINQYV